MGAVAYNSTTPNALYVGNGSAFVNVADGDSISASVLGVTFTSLDTNPSLTGNIYLQKQAVGAINLVTFSININQTITTTSATGLDVWSCPAATIPAAYRPAANQYFPGIVSFGGNFNIANTYFEVDSTGAAAITFTASSITQAIIFKEYSGVYNL